MNELYTIAWAEAGTKTPAMIIPPMDTNNHADQGMMVYRTLEAAQSSADYQTEWYNDGEDQVAVPVLLKDALELRTTREVREENEQAAKRVSEMLGLEGDSQ